MTPTQATDLTKSIHLDRNADAEYAHLVAMGESPEIAAARTGIDLVKRTSRDASRVRRAGK